MYENGVGVPENDADAVKWYRLAAKQGRARAQNNLGVMYENGEGVSENNAEAIKWFRLPSSEEMPPVRELLKRR
jgi:TPR repeat protein